MKETSIPTSGASRPLKIVYCPKCERYSYDIPPISVFRGKALRGIDKRTGEFRLRILVPKERADTDIMVKTFPRYIVTRPSELRARGRKVYTTKETTAKVYPELRSSDEVIVAGFLSEGLPLSSVLMRNLTLGVLSRFVDNEVRLKKGLLRSFSVRNPILVEAESLMEKTSK